MRVDRLRLTRNKARRSKGQSMVELAIAMPLMLLLMLGTIDLGRMFFDYVELRNAVREGAGYGARMPGDTTGMRARVLAHGVPDGTQVTQAGCTPVETGGCTLPGKKATVTVSASSTFTPVTLGFLSTYFGMEPITVTSSATMRVLT
jgi:Flp pilus assembly protein TadG